MGVCGRPRCIISANDTPCGFPLGMATSTTNASMCRPESTSVKAFMAVCTQHGSVFLDGKNWHVIQGFRPDESGVVGMSGIEHLAEAISEDLKSRLPGQRKTQREKLALCVARMLEVRIANLMDLAASLPRAAEELVMRYQWIKRLLANDLVDSD